MIKRMALAFAVSAGFIWAGLAVAGCEPTEGDSGSTYEKSVCRDEDGWLRECK